jgi:hypothetical protein
LSAVLPAAFDSDMLSSCTQFPTAREKSLVRHYPYFLDDKKIISRFILIIIFFETLEKCAKNLAEPESRKVAVLAGPVVCP